MSKRRLIQIAFVVLGLAWMGFIVVDLFGSTIGDCIENDASCERAKELVSSRWFWRSLAVTLLIFMAYRFLRVEPED